MIPLRSYSDTRTVPIVTTLLIAINIVVFFFELSQGRHIRDFFDTFGLRPANAAVVPLITSIFLHSGFLHILGNMWYLRIFGRGVEDRMGHMRFLFFYLACGVVAGITHVVMNPRSTLPVVGASGAIAGVMGAYLVAFPAAQIRTFVFIQVIDVPAFVVLGFWIVTQFASGATALTSQAA